MRCADLGSGLRARTTSAKERVGCCEAHRGPGVERAAVQDGWRQAPAAVRGGTCGGVEGGASPGVWAARIDARRRCETVAGVRKVQGSLKTTNCSGAGSHRRAIQAKFRRGGAWAPGPGTWGVPWGYGDVLERVCRGSGAAEGRGHGGAEGSERRSRAGRGGVKVWAAMAG